jgi:hypothetical protein
MNPVMSLKEHSDDNGYLPKTTTGSDRIQDDGFVMALTDVMRLKVMFVAPNPQHANLR